MTDIDPGFDEDEFDGSIFYAYRYALLYWLKGPHHMRMIELIPSYAILLQKLALELELEDSKFLLDAINESNARIMRNMFAGNEIEQDNF